MPQFPMGREREEIEYLFLLCQGQQGQGLQWLLLEDGSKLLVLHLLRDLWAAPEMGKGEGHCTELCPTAAQP